MTSGGHCGGIGAASLSNYSQFNVLRGLSNPGLGNNTGMDNTVFSCSSMTENMMDRSFEDDRRNLFE